ncbi:MAG TPA: peptide-methionine (S)-S-oxide reductase MsrA [Gemmatimonadota bacterium]|nr:peptide-methionine (S)-S-oxide reductase MsrA [Gemmatimonadota bacterium]
MDRSCDIPGATLTVTPDRFPDPIRDLEPTGPGPRTAVLAGGCFWCVEAVYRQLDGVLEVVSGYAGGTAETADYKTVCTGTTDHAEAVRVTYDPTRIRFGELLKVFFSVAHDPTQLDRQGNDRGRQYRSAVFYADEKERSVAEAYIRQLDEAGVFGSPIVTRLEPLEAFYEAETYHQNYAETHPDQPYIASVAAPKVAKLRHHYGDRLKTGRLSGMEREGTR